MAHLVWRAPAIARSASARRSARRAKGSGAGAARMAAETWQLRLFRSSSPPPKSPGPQATSPARCRRAQT
eukprot:13639568-Alexandrium_andersonii.AAC.1